MAKPVSAQTPVYRGSDGSRNLVDFQLVDCGLRRAKRSVHVKKWTIVFVLMVVISGCDGGSSPSTPTSTPPAATAPPAPSQASITVSASNGLVIASGAGNLVQLSVALRETAGVGANINFLRLEIFRATGEFEERTEIGAADIIAGIGDNRLAANSTESMILRFFFRATVKTGRQMLLTVNLTDDRGNNLQATFPYVLN